MKTTKRITVRSLLSFIGFYSGMWVPLLFVLAVLPLTFPLQTCIAEAQSVPVDFCFRVPVTVTNNTGGVVTDQEVRMLFNADSLISAGTMEDHGWDLRPVDAALAAREMMAQDLDSATAPWWTVVDGTIADGTSRTFSVYMGHESAKRNQAFEFTGGDSIAVTHTSDLTITDRLGIVATIQTDSPLQDATIIDKFTGSSGYRLLLVDSGGVAKVRAQINSATFDVPAGAFSGDETTIRVEFIAPTLEIFFDDVSQGTSNTGEGSIATTTTAVLMGTAYTGVIREAEIRKNVGLATIEKVARWGFHPLQIAELTSVDPTYTGTVDDEIGSNDGVYTLSRSQANITVELGAVALTFSNVALTAQERFVDMLGPLLSVDPFTLQTPIASNLPFFGALDSARAAIGIPQDAFWVGIIGIFSGALAFLVYSKAKRYDVAAAVPGAAFLIGTVIGLVEPWVVMIYGILAAGLWLFARWQR